MDSFLLRDTCTHALRRVPTPRVAPWARRMVAWCGVLTAAFLLVGCESATAVKVGKNPKVVVTRPIVAKVMDYQDFTGRLEAVKSVEVRARVTGYVTAVLFNE